MARHIKTGDTVMVISGADKQLPARRAQARAPLGAEG